jgi:UDP-GlcNAc3NAcA epimerase
MPEEINRICCDHMSSMLFVPTKQGIKNLMNEGFSTENNGTAELNNPHIYHCGDVMYDNSLYFSQNAQSKSHILDELKLNENQFILCTIHRDSNTDNKVNLLSILEALQNIQESSGLHIVLPLHPRTKKKIDDLNKEPIVKKILSNDKITIIPPLGFFDIIELEKNSRLIITDSGGLQKEAFFFKKPCVILREQTEWVEIVENGNAIVCGADYQKINSAVNSLMVKTNFTYPSFYGDGNAGKFICSKILSEL